jgi:hypothetical protein
MEEGYPRSGGAELLGGWKGGRVVSEAMHKEFEHED